MENNMYGAAIERGVILAAEAGGYRVSSLTRYGIVTPPIQSVNEDAVYHTGDKIYFFLFPDGDGRIIGKI